MVINKTLSQTIVCIVLLDDIFWPDRKHKMQKKNKTNFIKVTQKIEIDSSNGRIYSIENYMVCMLKSATTQMPVFGTFISTKINERIFMFKSFENSQRNREELYMSTNFGTA